MKNLLKALLMTLLATSLLACVSQPQQPAQPIGPQRPAWIDNPQSVGDIVGLGRAGYHFKGAAAQRELATSRALDEIARQMGVTVSNVLVASRQATNTSHSSSLATSTEQTVKGNVVNAVVHGEWKEGDTLYILMVGR
ncbi:hypothetical protein [Marinospirillum insulare]|uniref:LPP20 lipoprotein n=1 Tax=Marinospirillum insulare TaxID=217169 RepID=A0ABQ5ZU66_9GAMM|nr:hypothetical protein [Marinospirillum insulare]GLR63715.1 hypothetical protein GCM10007878_11500 [Marinospirillum insulare]